MDDKFYNQVSNDRLSSRQIDELIGISRGLLADETLNQSEIEFLQKWLAANRVISDQPVVNTLYQRVNDILLDKIADENEREELFQTLMEFSRGDFEIGEVLKATTLPLCDPPPELNFLGRLYCFTGTFTYGQRRYCEQAVVERGGNVGGLTQKTSVLVIGTYATESWKHSAFGDKIMKASKFRDKGVPISIVSEEHWIRYL